MNKKLQLIVGIILIAIGVELVSSTIYGFIMYPSDSPEIEITILGYMLSLLWSLPFFIIGVIFLKKYKKSI